MYMCGWRRKAKLCLNNKTNKQKNSVWNLVKERKGKDIF